MKAAESIASRFGATMLESIGVRTPVEGNHPATPPKVIAMSSPEDGRKRNRESGYLEIENIVPDPEQPRKYFDSSIDEMAESLKKHGQLEPLVVHWQKDIGKWMIICGERRYRGAVKAGLKELKCECLERELSKSEIRELQLVENIQREELRPIELAHSYKELLELNSWTLDQLAASLKKSKATISRTMSLLRLPIDVQDLVNRGDLSASSAYEILKKGSPEEQSREAARVVAGGVTRDELTGRRPRVPEGEPDEAESDKPEKAKPAVKVFKVGTASITIKWAKASIRKRDIVAALEGALAELRGEGKDTPTEVIHQ
jgi:ParB family chromosome partitioning protein